jgi:penicillin-binding protein 1A
MQDRPVRIVLTGGQVWQPRNYTPGYDGPITLRDALARSKNTVTVQLAQQLGINEVIRTAQDLGIDTSIPAVPAAALGAAGVRPWELVRAYAAFDNGGVLVEPHFVRRVEDADGNVVWEAEPQGARVVEPEAAFVLTTMLRDVVDRGTGNPVRAAGFRGPAAGKTGTTNGATDVWFVGYTPELVGAVWFGFDKPATILENASGGTLAAPVWARIMGRIYQGRRMPMGWAAPAGVVEAQVDRRTGLAMDATCPGSGQTYTEYFIHSAPIRQTCYPAAPYPAMAMGDSAWRDDESGAWSYTDSSGMTDLQQRGIDWPELEEKRRREAAGAPPAPPLPGNVEEPYGSAPSLSTVTPEPPSNVGTRRSRITVSTSPAEPVASGARETPVRPRRSPPLLGRPAGGDTASARPSAPAPGVAPPAPSAPPASQDSAGSGP